jgi:GT2 family glycosyltransferase
MSDDSVDGKDERSSGTVSISIVTFHTDWSILERCLEALVLACNVISGRKRCVICVVDNSDVEFSQNLAVKLSSSFPRVRLLYGHGNIGYGRANNLAIAKAHSEYHLILNPDAFVDENALKNALNYFERNAYAVLVSACGFSEKGIFLFLAKREPSFFLLVLRGFAPHRIKSLFVKQLNHYEMREKDWKAGPLEIEYASGAFMFCRTKSLLQIGGFDPKYFLYFEDFELCRRLRLIGALVQLPNVRFVHLGGSTGAKGYRHIKYFVISALRFAFSE